jgi:hypothetical protein
MAEPTMTTRLKYPLARRSSTGRPIATKKKSCTEPIELISEEAEVPERVYRSWYTLKDEKYPKVAKSASQLQVQAHQDQDQGAGDNVPAYDGAPRLRATL